MTQYAMIIDLNRCIGCHACAIACKAEWEGPADKGRNWVNRLGPDHTPYGVASTYYPGLCNHCDRPACVPVCPVDAVDKTFSDLKSGKDIKRRVAATWKDPFNGTVQIDKERCIGCGLCVEACPYGARYVNKRSGKPKADKCTFCVERLAEGLAPACVQTCLADARIFGDLDDPESELQKYLKRGAIGLESKAVRIGPNVRYLGKKQDMHLLTVTSTPKEMPKVNMRRTVVSQLLKPVAKKITGF